MDKIAVIKTGGKQYKVKEGQVVKIEKLDKKKGIKVKFDTLMIATTDGKILSLGKPFLVQKTSGEVMEEGRDKKIKVVKYKNKTRYKKTYGHKQPFTKVKITSID